MIAKFLNGSFVLTVIVIVVASCPGNGEAINTKINTTMKTVSTDSLYATLSTKLLRTVRDSGNYEQMVKKLANVSVEELDNSLDTEGERKAFWLNIYNAYVQILLGEKPERLKTRRDFFGYNFFSSPQITIAGHELSLDDIEHGIIRRSKVKLALGYMNKWGWWVDDFERRFRLDTVDYRVHFALNCGAASCPRIPIFEYDRVDQQLDLAAKQFLESSTDYHPEEKVVEVVKYFSWFRGDFGGVDQVPAILKKYNVIPESADPTVEFKDYNWSVDLGNYTDV